MTPDTQKLSGNGGAADAQAAAKSPNCETGERHSHNLGAKTLIFRLIRESFLAKPKRASPNCRNAFAICYATRISQMWGGIFAAQLLGGATAVR